MPEFPIPLDAEVITTVHVRDSDDRVDYIEHDANGEWYFFGTVAVKDKREYVRVPLSFIVERFPTVKDWAHIPRIHFAHHDPKTDSWVGPSASDF